MLDTEYYTETRCPWERQPAGVAVRSRQQDALVWVDMATKAMLWR